MIAVAGNRGKGVVAGLALALMFVFGQAIGSAQAATTVNVNPVAPSGANAFPFGEGDFWTPYMGFVYRNIQAFDLKTGDTISFDLGVQNDADIKLQISMAATSFNGSDVPGPYTTVVSNTQLPANPRGNAVNGDYELTFTSEAPFHFAGGGLIIRFSNPGSSYATDGTPTGVLSNAASSSDSSGFFLERFYADADGLPPYTTTGLTAIGGFRLQIADLPPAPPAPTPTPKKKKCKKKHKKRSAAAAKKKCKKKRH